MKLSGSKVSDKYYMITEGSPSEFLVMVEWLHRDFITKNEETLMRRRLDNMNLEMIWGCCGHNIIREKAK